MAVNYDIWGAPETWVPSGTESLYYNIDARFPATYRSYYSLYHNNVLEPNSVDISNCFWGIGKDSLFLSLKYLSPYINNDVVSVDVRDVYEEQIDRPCIIVHPPNTACTSYYYRYSPDRTADSYPDSSIYYNDVVLDFNYQKTKTIPIVFVRSTPQSSYTAAYRLDEYLNNRRTTYPYIVGLGYNMTFDGSVAVYGMSTATVGHVKGYNLSYGSNFFYARTTGIDNFISCLIEGECNKITKNFITSENINYTVGDSETAFAYKYCIGDQSRPALYNYDGDPLWELYTDYMDGSTRKYCVGYAIHVTNDNINDVRDYVLKQMAFLGFPFIYNYSDRSRHIGDTGVYLPKFDDNGVTTGEYEEGQNALTLPNSQWTDGRESGYDPNRTPDGDTGNLNNFPTYQNRYANANAVYALDESNFIKFVDDVNNLYLNDADDTQMKLDFKGSNPNDYIIGVYGVPFLCNYVVPSGGDTSINLGPVTLPTAQGKKVDTTLSLMRDCGTVTIPAKGNFLDYEPYTQIELYIPMCGTIQLDCAQVVGHTLHVIVYYDVTTMACVGCVYRDSFDGETLIHTINGTIGASLPLTSARMGDYQNSVQTTKNALKQNEMRTALGLGGAAIGIAGAALAPETGGLSLALAGAAIGGLATAAGGAMTEKQLQYDLTHKQPALSQCSAADGMTAQLVSDLRPWIFIKRAKKLESYDAETYGKTVGFACCINSTVGAFSGYTVYSNVDLSGIPATKTEIDMIRAKLNSGIYI